MNRLKLLLSSIILLYLCSPVSSVAQTIEDLSDSLVYNIAVYKDLYGKYSTNKGLLQQDLIETIKEQFPDASTVGLSTKFENLGADSAKKVALTEVVNQKFGSSITEEQSADFFIVNDIFEALRPKGDSIMLIMAYYPWRTVFDSHKVHRVSVYEDGIGLLGDLITLTTDSVQREIYLNDLMEVYDVWYEYVDSVNERIDAPYSRTMILSNKAIKYDEMLPIVYNLEWDVKDTLQSKAINENVFSPQVIRLYDYIRDALYEQDAKGDLQNELPYKFFRLSHSRLNYLNKLGKFRAYTDQYTRDFDSVNARFELYKTMELGRNNVAWNHDIVTDMYDEASGAILIGTSKDWRKKEPEFRKQLYEKMELWDFGIESPDHKFLNRVINGINTDSSDVYIEAMEMYINLPATEETFDNIIKYRKRLAAYYEKNKRYDDAMALYRKLLGDEKNPEVKAALYYNVGECLLNQKDFGRAQTNYNNAISLNPEYGDAYYKLALCYEQIKFYKDPLMDRYKLLLCIDKLNLAKECLTRNSTGAMRKYNRIPASLVSQRINALIPYCPSESEVFMLPPDFRTVGKTISFGKAGKTTVRFYNK